MTAATSRCLRATFVLLALARLLGACGEEARPSAPGSTIDDIRGDGGDQSPDARIDTEPATHDHVLESGDVVLCGYDDDDVTTVTAHAELHRLAIATDDRGFALLRYDQDGALVIDALPTGAPAEGAVRLATAEQALRAPMIAAADDRFFMLYEESGALYLRVLAEGYEPYEVSSELVGLAGGGDAYALVATSDRLVVSFVQDGELRVQRFDLEAEPIGEPTVVSTERVPEHVQLARLDAGRILLGWLQGGEARARVFDAALEPEGSVRVLSKHEVGEPRFALAARALSAGLLYARLEGDSREALDYQRIEPSGEASNAVLGLVPAPRRARDGSITDFGQGYAIAYRALPSLGAPDAQVKLAFINQFGRVVHEVTLAETNELPADTAIGATRDGHLLVAFTTRDGAGAHAQLTRLYCPGALVLCGGELE